MADVDDPELAMQFVPVKGLFVGRLAAAFCNWLAIPGTEAKLTDPFLTREVENCPMIVEISADDENAVEEAPVVGLERHKFVKKSGVKSAKMTLVLDRIPKILRGRSPRLSAGITIHDCFVRMDQRSEQSRAENFSLE